MNLGYYCNSEGEFHKNKTNSYHLTSNNRGSCCHLLKIEIYFEKIGNVRKITVYLIHFLFV